MENLGWFMCIIACIIGMTVVVTAFIFAPDEKPPKLTFDGAPDNGIMRDGEYLVWVEEGKQVLRVKCEDAT